MSNNYLGITIGPIFNTINLAFSPGALWTGSYMFSYLTKTLCKLFVESGIPEANIVSPYYAKDCKLLHRNDGVGLFHDRIILRVDKAERSNNRTILYIGESAIDFESIKEKALKELSENFEIAIDYLREYIKIEHVCFEAEHPIKGCSKILDCLELAAPFMQRDTNDMLAKFINEGNDNANEKIKSMPILQAIGDKWQLNKPGAGIKTLGDIAMAGVTEDQKRKKHSYYAIVRSDGDKMSDIFLNLKSGKQRSADEKVREYSKACLVYCAEIAELVKEYGGITIYSGGDDLLAIMPLEKHSRSKSNIPDLFSFLKEANKVMEKNFKKLVDDLNNERREENLEEVKYPTLSFGVTIVYERYPLYEALRDSQYLLFDVAKNYRNCTALRVCKHSGQSEGIIIPNSALGKVIALKEHIDSGLAASSLKKSDDPKKSDDLEKADRIFLSALYKLNQFDAFFTIADTDTRIQNLFDNFFDADEHFENVFLKEKLPEYFKGIAKADKEYAVRLMPEYLRYYLIEKHITPDEKDDQGNMAKPYPVPTLCYLLRILKLYYEKAGEKV